MRVIAPKDTSGLLGDGAAVLNLLLRLYTHNREDLLPAAVSGGQRNDGTDRAKVAAYKSAAKWSRLMQDTEGSVLRELRLRQERLLESLPAWAALGPFHLELESNLTCGMALPTLLENGLTLLRPWGIPIIPGTAVKGILRSWLAEVLAGELNLKEKAQDRILRDAGFRDLFGHVVPRGEGGKRGQILFFDALPCEGAAVDLDGTTVHYPKWYSPEGPGQVAPAGFENPVPIPFITVKKGTRFQFCFAIERGAAFPDLSERRENLEAFDLYGADDLEGFLEKLLVSTGAYKGFGSQTSTGFGRMKTVPVP